MEEYEPIKKKKKVINKKFVTRYTYALAIAVFLMGGISYGYTFFNQNKKLASASIKISGLSIESTDKSILTDELVVPTSIKEGLNEYKKSITINNSGTTDGIVTLKVIRTNGLQINDLRYALIVNDTIQKIGDLEETILINSIMSGEKLDVELRLWPKPSYKGEEKRFVGKIDVNTKYLGSVASSMDNLTGKYVNFNCNENCELWRIVKVEDRRLVLTKEEDYENASSRVNSNRYHDININDNNLVTSVSTDDKNVYLSKTVKIDKGSGTNDNPYTLINPVNSISDKKIIGLVTYKNSDTTLGEQHIYYNDNNYVSRTILDDNFKSWVSGNIEYHFGDSISTNNDIVLNASFIDN